MAKHHSRPFLAHLVFASALLVLVSLALYPDLDLPKFWPAKRYTDFVYHTFGFFALTASAMIAFGGRIQVAFSMIVLALTLEFLQSFVPGREVFWIDAFASLLGVGFAIVFRILVTQYWRRWLDVAHSR